MLKVRDLCVTYPDGRRALEGVSFDLAAGERLALIGESGSGKSTLARAVAGLLPEGSRVSGTVTWDAPPRLGRDIGYVFQDPGGSLDPLLSITAHLVETLRAHLPLGRGAARERAGALLAEVALPGIGARYPHQLSGGQRQRVAIALALAAAPRLVIADEATSALDVLVQQDIVALLHAVTAGRSLLFITHDIALAAGLAERVVVLHGGRIVEQGRARDVLHAPRADYTRLLLGEVTRLNSPRLVS